MTTVFLFMRSIGLLATAVLVVALPAFGCSANVSATPEQADAEASSPTAAVIVVQRTIGDGTRGEAVARFIRVRGRQDQGEALRVVGAAVDFPALGTCLSLTTFDKNPSALAAPVAHEPAPSVQLLDVGAVSMEANGVQTQLFARQVPDVVDLVSGVVYATPAPRITDAEFLPARGRYVLRVAGAHDADAFVVTASAPGDLAELRVAGQDGRVVVLPSGGAADLAWEPGATDDMVYVDVNATSLTQGSTHAPTIRCAFTDAGRATIAAALLPDDGTLSIHRVHRERFRAPRIDSGEMRFDFAKVVSFSRR